MKTNIVKDQKLWAKMVSANQIARLQDLKKEVNDEVYFWYADKH